MCSVIADNDSRRGDMEDGYTGTDGKMLAIKAGNDWII